MSNLQYEWLEISDALHTFRPTQGGFTQAKRGLITLNDGRCVFIKEATDTQTTKWLSKEIQTYKFLTANGYAHMPKLLAANEDQSAIAIEAFTLEDGWSWEATWDKDRLTTTLKAMDDLAEYSQAEEATSKFSDGMISPTSNWWRVLKEDPDRIIALETLLAEQHSSATLSDFDLNKIYRRSQQYRVRTDVLVHNDVRADNCAWNIEKSEIKLVDWNWCQMSDFNIDRAALFVHVERSGHKVSKSFLNKVDPDAFLWLAGFWLNSAASVYSENRSELKSLRQHQLESGLIALAHAEL